ncbi:MAG TPA: aldo/keto reductase [Polyangiaceae bacterium]
MQHRPFGSSGVLVPVVGEGTWNMEQDTRAEAIRAIRRGLDLGITHVDTAEMYGSGSVEQLVAEAIAGRRGDVFLVSKVLPNNASRSGTLAACERTLARLKTDYLDCYLLHWPGEHPLEETIRAFEELERAGKIRSFGVSNFDARELEEAVRIAGTGRIACNQVLYHLEERSVEHEVLPACKRLGAPLVAYSPLGSGNFPSSSSHAGRALAAIAEKHGASPRQIALAFLMRDQATFVIPKASRVEHVEDNAKASSVTLDANDIAAIDAAFPRPRRRSGVPML